MPAADTPHADEPQVRICGYTVTRAEWREAELICYQVGYVDPIVIELIAIGIHRRNNRTTNPIKETS